MDPEPKVPGGLTDASSECWYLRIDGHNYGPVPRAELENFLRPPRLCSVMEVKCGDGVWFTIARHETIDKVLVKFGIEVEPTSEPHHEALPNPTRQPAARAPARLSSLSGWLRDFFEGLVAWLLYHWIATSVVLVYLAGNAVFLIALRDPHAGDREILARYEDLWSQSRAFDAEDTPSDAWRAFAAPALTELEPLLRQLERSASVHQPIRQNLLFAGRDNLTKILKAERPPAPQDVEVRLFERRLQLAREQLPADDAGAGIHERNSNRKASHDTSRFYDHRAAGVDHGHRHSDSAPASRRANGPRCQPPGAVSQQSAADGDRLSQLSRELRSVSPHVCCRPPQHTAQICRHPRGSR